MEDMLFKLIELFNPIQSIFFIILGIIFYFKIKNAFSQQINGLGLRFDNQFGEYKDKNKTEMDLLKERIYKLEVEIQFVKKTQHQQIDNI